MTKVPSNVRERFSVALKWALDAKPQHFRDKDMESYLDNEIRQNKDKSFWMYFGDETAEKCQKSNKPNLWIGEPIGTVSVGIDFNNISSYDRLQQLLLHSLNLRNKLTEGTGWKTRVYIRKKEKANWLSPAEYIPSGEEINDLHIDIFKKTGQIMVEWDEARDKCLKLIDEGHKGSGPSVSLIQKYIKFEEKLFKDEFSFAYEVLRICLDD